MIRKIQWFAMAVTAVLCAACDAHIDVPDTAVRPGHILCEDGTALSYVQYEQSGKRAIAVVFDTEHREGTEGNGYAVYLWDIAPAAFADSLGVAQGTSADIGALDGHPLPLDENDCWYWTSTEVTGQETAKAWLYSTGSGAMQETPKTQAHKVRPIITINK